MAAIVLRRLRLVSPSTIRQLFRATVALVVDYDSNVWMYACGYKGIALINRIQRARAQAITGAFRIVATIVVEAEANIRTASNRHVDRETEL